MLVVSQESRPRGYQQARARIRGPSLRSGADDLSYQ
jgi:hypothetical protein